MFEVLHLKETVLTDAMLICDDKMSWKSKGLCPLGKNTVLGAILWKNYFSDEPPIVFCHRTNLDIRKFITANKILFGQATYSPQNLLKAWCARKRIETPAFPASRLDYAVYFYEKGYRPEELEKHFFLNTGSIERKFKLVERMECRT